jgi:hypothetical protein
MLCSLGAHAYVLAISRAKRTKKRRRLGYVSSHTVGRRLAWLTICKWARVSCWKNPTMNFAPSAQRQL